MAILKAAMWQDPQATSYLALSLAAMTASGTPPGFDVSVGTLYERVPSGYLSQDHAGFRCKAETNSSRRHPLVTDHYPRQLHRALKLRRLPLQSQNSPAY